MSDLTVNIDAGGTFTDGVFTVGERLERAKVPTTAHDLTVCFVDCIEAGADALDRTPGELLAEAAFVRFSTTVGTNTIIERDGPTLGLLVTAGNEEDCYAPSGEPPVTDTLVDPALVHGIEESVTPDGTVEQAPDPDAVTRAVKALQSAGARIVVVALEHAFANAANERAVKRAIEDEYPSHYLGAVPTIASHEVSARPDPYRRLNTATVNAYIHRPMKAALYRAEDYIREAGHGKPLFVGHADGGVARAAKTVAIDTYNSGPAAGVLGVRRLSALYGEDLIGADMGGTSIDLGVVRDGRSGMTLSPAIGGLPTHVPAVAVHNAGAGGGSIVTVEDGELSVGPESAGANPGPACFGRGGTEATVTDADVVRGVVNPAFFLGGGYDIDADRARSVLETAVAEPLGIGVEAAAARVAERVQRTIAEEILALDAAVGTLVAYGGAGPVHAAGFAAAAGADSVIVTPYSSVFSAFGESTMDVHHTYARPLPSADPTLATEGLAALRDEAERDMRAEGIDPDEIAFEADLLVAGSTGDDRLDPLEAADADAVQAAVGGLEAPATLRLHAIGRAPTPTFEAVELGGADPADARVGERPVWWTGEPQETPVYRFAGLMPGNAVAGPAVVEAADTTIALPPETSLAVDEYGHARLDVGGQAD